MVPIREHIFQWVGCPHNCTSAVSHRKMLDIYNIRVTVCTKIVYVANGVRVDRPPIRCRYVDAWLVLDVL